MAIESLQLRQVTKLDAAREQLQEAITLFFEDRSAIAIHTLVLSAHQVLHDYTERKASMIKNDRALNEHGQSIIQRYNREFNFFKHAKGDKNDTLKFDPELHTFFLADALHLFAAATGEWPRAHQAFNFWFILKRPNMVESEVAKKAVAQALAWGWTHENKKVFLRMIREPGFTDGLQRAPSDA
ncbi:hypothetical protein ACVNIS_06530 [Sphaerotilaceae bacterium SBD11-9]